MIDRQQDVRFCRPLGDGCPAAFLDPAVEQIDQMVETPGFGARDSGLGICAQSLGVQRQALVLSAGFLLLDSCFLLLV
jgi:hypothetical protein